MSQLSECEKLLEKAQLLVQRLERLSADSAWAHRSSGYRGSLLRLIDKIECQKKNYTTLQHDFERLENLMKIGYDILNHAAGEIPDTN